MFKEREIQEFCQELGSKAPAPGGGSASALSGSLAASLLLMVSRLSQGDDPALFDPFIEELTKYEEDLFHLMDEDTKAFKQVMEAFKIPKEKEERKVALEEAFTKATEVPLEVMEISCHLLSYAKELVLKGNSNALSDSGVGGLLAGTALKGAHYNVLINLPYLKDRERAREYTKTMERLYQKGSKTLAEVERLMEEGLKEEG